MKKALILLGISAVVLFLAYLFLPSLVALTTNIFSLVFFLIVLVGVIYALYKLINRLV